MIEPYIETVINGDTDSVKVLADDSQIFNILESLEILSNAIDKSKEHICQRVESSYPRFYDELADIGHYVLEFYSDAFCASWNKAYCEYDLDDRDGKRHFKFTLAGIPTKRINDYCDDLIEQGWTFEQVCNVFLGYNVTFAYDLIYMNGRKFPKWGETFFERVTDYLGNESMVCEPASLALYPMSKTINDTANIENRENSIIAHDNNEGININDLIVYSNGIANLSDLWG